MAETSDLEEIPIYSLTCLTPSEQASLLDRLGTECEGLDFKPKIVPWSEPEPGTEQDILRIHRLTETPTRAHQFFIDARTLRDNSIIIACQDIYFSGYSTTAHEFNLSLASSLGFPPGYYQEWEPVYDDEEMVRLTEERGLPFGRVPAESFGSVEANLSLGNMGLSELVEYRNGIENHQDRRCRGMDIIENDHCNWGSKQTRKDSRNDPLDMLIDRNNMWFVSLAETVKVKLLELCCRKGL